MTRELHLSESRLKTPLELAAKYGHDNVLSAQAIIMGNPERAHRFYLGEISAEELVRGHPGELEALLERWESEE